MTLLPRHGNVFTLKRARLVLLFLLVFSLVLFIERKTARGVLDVDGDLIPGSSSTFKLGDRAKFWRNINEIIYFYDGNVGFGHQQFNVSPPDPPPYPNTPLQAIEVRGEMQLVATSTALPCDTTRRGGFRVRILGVNATDTVEVCIREANGAFNWRTIY